MLNISLTLSLSVSLSSFPSRECQDGRGRPSGESYVHCMTGVDFPSITVSNHGSIGKQLETAFGEEVRVGAVPIRVAADCTTDDLGSFSMLILVKMRPCPSTYMTDPLIRSFGLHCTQRNYVVEHKFLLKNLYQKKLPK